MEQNDFWLKYKPLLQAVAKQFADELNSILTETDYITSAPHPSLFVISYHSPITSFCLH